MFLKQSTCGGLVAIVFTISSILLLLPWMKLRILNNIMKTYDIKFCGKHIHWIALELSVTSEMDYKPKLHIAAFFQSQEMTEWWQNR